MGSNQKTQDALVESVDRLIDSYKYSSNNPKAIHASKPQRNALKKKLGREPTNYRDKEIILYVEPKF